MNEIINHGFIPDVKKPEDYIFGSSSLPTEILQPDGKWDAYLPVDEFQNINGIETYNCTGFGTLNCLEILYKRLFNQDANYSDRYTAICAGTDPIVLKGNSPQTVIQNIRNTSGVIDESLLPFNVSTVEDYYKPKPMTSELLNKGSIWLSWHNVFHEWVDGSPESMKEALKLSPLGAGVYAWAQEGEYFVRKGADSHWICIYGYEDGKFWKCFDSYDNTHKKLAWDFGFQSVKRYHIDKLLSQKQRTIIQQIITLFYKIIAILKI